MVRLFPSNGTAQKRLLESESARPKGQSLKNFRIDKEHPDLYINRQPSNQVYEFENLEELRRFDPKYQNHSDNEAMELVSRTFKVPESDIRNIK